MSTAPVWQGSDAELLAELGALETQMHSTWAQMLSVVAEIDSRGTAGAVGYGTTVELVRAVARVSRGEARARVALGSGELPTEGGERPQVVVTVSLPVLQGRIGSASLAMGGPINADIARRIACDAQVIPVVLGARGEPLDVGRASHTVPTAIRRAVIVRDGGCSFPGCSAPARWCDIHHVIHWADGGLTSVGNCVALCGRHHRLIHHSDWRIDMASGIPDFHPPPWLGGPPRRNPLHIDPELIRIRQ